MHVLYVIDSFLPGGAENSLLALAPALADRGCTIDVAYLFDRPGIRDEFEAAGIEVTRVEGRNRLTRALALRRMIKRRRPDLVHTTLFEADLVGRVAALGTGVPVVSSLVNIAYGPEQRAQVRQAWKLRLARALDAGTSRFVVRFHAISSGVADVMAVRLRVLRSSIDVIPRGRDPHVLGTRESQRRARAREALGIGDQPLVLAVARQEPQKGLDVLLRALPPIADRHSEVRVVVAGREGNATSGLRELCSRLGIADRVQFLGPVRTVPELLCAADVFVLPSRWEGLGSVLLEAMALEAPIVASSLPVVTEVLEAGTEALLVDPEDAAGLARAVTATLADPAAAAARAARARQTFLRRFTIDRIADQTAAFYHRVAAGRDGPPPPIV